VQETPSISQKTLEHIKNDVKEAALGAKEGNKLQEGAQIKVTSNLQAYPVKLESQSISCFLAPPMLYGAFTATVLL